MRTLKHRFALLTICGAVAVGGVAAGCGDDDSDSSGGAESTTTAAESTTTDTTTTAEAQSADAVDIADFKYDPDAITVKAGAEITWTNSDDAAHTATADDGSFDTADLDKGDSKTVTFDQPGEFSYYCRFHPFMKATVEVR